MWSRWRRARSAVLAHASERVPSRLTSAFPAPPAPGGAAPGSACLGAAPTGRPQRAGGAPQGCLGGTSANVFLYDMGALEHVVAANRRARQQAALVSEDLV